LLALPVRPPWRGRLRAVQCPATDPFSFALARGEASAPFPAVDGWSADHVARRAVTEHRARLAVEPRTDRTSTAGLALGALLTAARAAQFLESVQAGEPRLAVTVTESSRRLAERSPSARTVTEEAMGAYRRLVREWKPPSSRTIAGLRELVRGLPAYRD
jgi:hypothetical protein